MNSNRKTMTYADMQERLILLDKQFEYLHERLIYLERRRWWQFWRAKTAYEYRKERRVKDE
jgi:hypothetical protein